MESQIPPQTLKIISKLEMPPNSFVGNYWGYRKLQPNDISEMNIKKSFIDFAQSSFKSQIMQSKMVVCGGAFMDTKIELSEFLNNVVMCI